MSYFSTFARRGGGGFNNNNNNNNSNKPLVRFEAADRATVVSTATPVVKAKPSGSKTKEKKSTTESQLQSLDQEKKMPPKRRRRVTRASTNGVKKRRRRTKTRLGRTSSKKPRVVKGRLQIRVGGYTGVQKIPPSSLIPFLPTNKIRLAAKRVLSRNSTSKRRGSRKRKGTKRKRRARK